MNKTLLIIILSVIILLLVGLYFFNQSSRTLVQNNVDTPSVVPADSESTSTSTASTLEPVDTTQTVIGTSTNGNEITAYHFGTGATELLYVGGIHGGYSGNTVLLSYELIDYLNANLKDIPDNIRVTVVPVLNPDGLEAVVGTTGRFSNNDVPSDQDDTIVGRFNGNNVDLNRNFDCQWQASSVWQNTPVSGGTSAFSEPETMAMRDFVTTLNPTAVVVWYSAAGGVYSSSCREGILPETRNLTNLYAKASGYTAHADFDSYEITGDLVNWLAKSDIPATSVLLTNYKDTEWSKNLAGITAMFDFYQE